MGKYEKKRNNPLRALIWIICVLIVLGLLAYFAMPQLQDQMNKEPIPDEIVENTAPQDQNRETLVPAEDSDTGNESEKTIEFPAVLDEGNIEVESLFQFSGVNPDAQNQKATDVASIVLKNTSGEYLSDATVTATLESGTELKFIVRDIPAGSAVMAFSIDNSGLLETDVCTDITVEAVFKDAPKNDGIVISVEGMMVTITNTSSEDLNDIDVYYRDVFNERYFGGMAYIYSIEHLSAGESITFTAEESLLGVIEVVHIAVNDKN